MKSLDEVIQQRRSIRAYQDKPVPKNFVRALLEAARLAPSACNSQTWRFIVVDDREVLNEIAQKGTRSVIRNAFLTQAPLLIVGCNKLDLVANRVGKAVTGIDYYQVDLGIAMEHIVLKATELGLGTCWIGWFNERKIKKILHIPSGIRVSALLTIGYPKGPLPPARPRLKLEEISYHNRWEHAFDWQNDVPE